MPLYHDFHWSVLLHLGTNLWYEEGNTRAQKASPSEASKVWRSPASPVLRFDSAVWEDTLARMQACGVNTIVLDIGEGLVYPSHPELASRGAWTPEKMRAELARMNDMGFEVIPKLNFSATHDVWLGAYSRRVSTPEYYAVCRDLIGDVCAIFHPKLFHLGMDEEVWENQKDYDYIVVRQGALWWHDLRLLAGFVEEHGARAMMWSDYAREHTEEFIEQCPRSIVQCVWYYFTRFYGELDHTCEIRVRPFTALAEAGFDIFPAGSLAYFDDNLSCLAEYCTSHVPRERLLGFMQTTWEPLTPEWRELHERSAVTVGDIRKKYERAL